MKRIFANMLKIQVAVLLIASVVFSNFAVMAENTDTNTNGNGSKNQTASYNNNSFLNYYQTYYSNSKLINELVKADMSGFEINDCKTQKFNDINSVLISEGKSISFNLNIKEDGIYPFALQYYNTADVDNEYIISLQVDGEFAYDECKSLSLFNVWEDSVKGDFAQDDLGNEIRPTQVIKEKWIDTYIYDSLGFFELPYFAYLEKGNHKITITSVRNTLALAGVTFGFEDTNSTYAEYSKNATAYEGENVTLQAEKTFEKNNSVLYPTYDRTNSATQPQDATNILLNTIGKDTWSKNGNYIVWQPEIKEAGWYTISLRARQKTNQGLYSYRTLKINGEIPFAEAKAIPFEYNANWYVKTLGADEPYLFYLEPGDVISLTATSEPISKILRSINLYTLELNALYRDVIAITSTSPDTYRDYMLNSQLPGLEEALKNLSDGLKEISAEFERITGTKGSQASIIDYVTAILDDFAYDCNEISERFSAFTTALENLGSLSTTVGAQPLELDYIVFGNNKDLDFVENNNFFKQTVFSIKTFLASFSSDYNSISADETEGKSITVWANVGRDQARTINNLIRNDYSAKYDSKINFSIVPGGEILIKASLAGKGPDVALMAGVPLELAARGALVPLTDYDLSPILDEFPEDIWTALTYNGEIYALPDTMIFHTLFYREDIFNEYGLSPSDTWDDFYKVIEELHKNQLKVGMPEINGANYGVSSGISIFSKLLLQNGGSYYTSDLKKTMFDTEEAFSAFEQWVEFHKTYGLPREYSFLSLFRTGEMPISIEGYTTYPAIAAAAPEIQGLWKMAPIPGTKKDDGTIDRSQYGTATGSYMLKSALEKGIDEEAFEFIRWWVSSDVQTTYAKELEATMGIAARYSTANLVTLQNLGWSESELEVLNSTIEDVQFAPQVPGNYLLQRSLTTAFRSAVSGKNRARRALTIANKEINDELARKREEFNLD